MADIKLEKYIKQTKDPLQKKITFFLIIIIFGYLIFFIPGKALGLDLNKMDLAEIFKYLITLATSAVLSYIIRIPLFATDSFATGKSKETEFIKGLYPSIKIIAHFNSKGKVINEGQANMLWFDFYNIWSQPNTFRHFEWSTMFSRSYNCRLIFYMKKVLGWAVVFSFISFFLYKFYHYIYSIVLNNSVSEIQKIQFLVVPDKIETLRILYLIVSVILFLFFKINNNPDKKNPTGCWFKYKESSEIQYTSFTEMILDKAEDYTSARAETDKLMKNPPTS